MLAFKDSIKNILLLIFAVLSNMSIAQNDICVNKATEHKIYSDHLNENRIYWISLPFKYADSLSYPVIYVLDAEWRFDLVRKHRF